MKRNTLWFSLSSLLIVLLFSINTSSALAYESEMDLAKQKKYLGDSLFNQKRFEEAKSVYEQSVKLWSQDLQTYEGLARTLLALKQYESALEVCQKVIGSDGKHPKFWMLSGNALVEKKDYPSAERAYRLSIHDEPRDFEARMGLGKLLFYTDRHKEAQQEFENAKILLPGSVDPYIWKGRSIAENGALFEGITEMSLALQFAPLSQEVHYQLGLLYLKQGNNQLAENELSQAAKLNVKDPRPLYELAILHLQTNRLVDAEKYFVDAIAIEPNDSKSLLGLGQVYLKQKNYTSANEYLYRAYTIDPNSSEILENLGDYTQETSSFDKSLEYYSKALENAVSPIPIGLKYSNVCVKANRLDDGIDLLEKLVKKHPNNINLNIEVGRLYALKGILWKSESYFRSAINLDSKSVDAHIGLGKILTRLERFDEADKEFVTVLDIDGSNSRALLGRGDVFLAKRGYSTAENQYTWALAVDPSLVEAEIGLARVWEGAGHKEKAAVQYNSIKRRYPAFDKNQLPNKPPIVNWKFSSISGPAPFTVSIDASNSSDPDGNISSWEWITSMGKTTGRNTTFTFPIPGSYQISLLLTDDNGTQIRTDKMIEVFSPISIFFGEVPIKLNQTTGFPVIKNDRVLVPIRLILETLGTDLRWNDAERTVTIAKDNTVIVLTPDSNLATVNGISVILDSSPIVDTDTGRMLVPLRFITEQFGISINYNAYTRVVTID